ncbi:hypothetical protein SNK04_014178 [Fusarium graminearum]
MTIKTKFAVAGHYTIRKYSAGGILIQELEFTNLITDAGLNMLETTPPGARQQQHAVRSLLRGYGLNRAGGRRHRPGGLLGHQLVADRSDRHQRHPGRQQLLHGAALRVPVRSGVGTGNLSELGTGTSSTNLFSRALIRDPITGNPVTITKLPDEFMDVTFELRAYVSASDTTGTVTISVSPTTQ